MTASELPPASDESAQQAAAQAAADLRESEEKYHAFFENSMDAILLTSPDGSIQAANPAACAMLGRTEAEICALGRDGLVDATDPRLAARLAERARTGRTYGELTMFRRDGTPFPVEMSSALFQDSHGRARTSMIIRDITEHKRAEEALRLSEEQFANAFYVGPAGMTITRVADGRFVDANESFLEMFEFSREEVIGHTSTELKMWTPEERYKLIQKQLESGGLQNFELQARASSGRLVHILFSSRPFELAGEPHHITTMIDITDRKRVEATLRESEERYRLLVDSSPYAIGIHQDGKIVFVNPAAVRIFRAQSPDDLIGKPISEIVHPEAWEAARQRIGRMLAGETGLYPTEDRYRRLDGSEMPVEVTATPFTYGGRPAIQVIALDITERKQVEEALRISEQKYRDIFDNAPLGIFQSTPDGKFISANSALANMLGYSSPEEMIRLVTNIAAQHYADPPIRSKEIIAALGAGGFVTLENRYRRTNGTTWIGRGHSRIVHDELGKPIYYEGFIEDITERKQAEDEIKALNAELEQRVADRTAELEARHKELETFTYSVSHDLKAPLRGIDGYSRLLLDEYTDKLDDEGRHFLHTIRDATRQMTQLIDDLLAYSRLERRPITIGLVNPHALVDSLITHYAVQIAERRATVPTDVGCTAVTAEAEGLMQALRNLLDNALKFTRDTPAPVIEIGSRETAQSCIMWVRDNGIGFDMKYHDRIFDIFQRLQRAEEYPGTGVGLAIVRKAVERMGGRVWAESTLGHGATFYLEIPK